jgi:hypothetical protein
LLLVIGIVSMFPEQEKNSSGVGSSAVAAKVGSKISDFKVSVATGS